MSGTMLFDRITGKPIKSVTDEVIRIDGQDRPVSYWEQRHFRPRKGYRFRRGGKDVMQICLTAPLPQELPAHTVGHFYRMLLMAHSENGLICVRSEPWHGHYTWRAALAGDIAKVIGLSLVKTYETLKTLGKYNIIKKVAYVRAKDNQSIRMYYINPLYIAPFYITKEVFNLWKEELKPLIPQRFWGLITGEFNVIDGEIRRNPEYDYTPEKEDYEKWMK